MDLQLQDKTAIVTGSSAGIGFAIAQALLREGATVIINGRTQDRVAKALQLLNSAGASGTARGVVADLSLPAGVDQFAREVPVADILVNNLGIYEAKSFEEITDDDWHHIIEVNLMS